MPNPFFYGNPVPPKQLIDRTREIRRIVGRIINQGQSTAIVGEPRSGKTSLLLYLAAPEKRQELYSDMGQHLLFSFLDVQAFSGQLTQAEFWQQALYPLAEAIGQQADLPKCQDDTAKVHADQLAQLHQKLDDYFDTDELQDVCFKLGVDWDNLDGQRKSSKARDLVAQLDRQGRLPELIKQCATLRPKVDWGNVPGVDKTAQPEAALSPLAQAYQVCQVNGFGLFVLERLFAQMNLEGWRLVLLLDEFNDLLHHPILNSAEFFGSLRSLASRSRGALALVIASRHSLTSLNEDTQQFSRGGSPYFNFLDEIALGPLPDNAVTELLQLAGDLFTPADRRFIVEMAGAHPYLLQAAASALWEAYTGDEDNGKERMHWQQASASLYDEAAKTIGETWKHWSPEMRQAFTTVALAHMSVLEQYAGVLKENKFDVKRLSRDVPKFKTELAALDKLGYIAPDDSIPGGWRVRPGIFLWWLTDELARMARREQKFEEWWQNQQIEGMLTKGEKQKLGEAARAFGGLLKQGAQTLVQAAAKGAGEALVKK